MAKTNGQVKKTFTLRPAKPVYRVLLSIDGGGVRGMIPATVMEGFERAAKAVLKETRPECKDLDEDQMIVNIKDCFDTIAGTSVGSLLTLYYGSGGGVEDLYKEGKPLHGCDPGSAAGGRKLFEASVKGVFTPPLFGRYPILRNIGGLARPKYTDRGIKREFNNVFGDLTMKDLKTSCFIPSYELNNARAVAFYSRKVPGQTALETGYAHERSNQETCGEAQSCGSFLSGQFKRHSANVPLKVAAQASAAAPVFFPAASLNQKDQGDLGIEGDIVRWADGALVCNNPTLQALLFMMASFAHESNEPGSFFPMKRLAVLSIGCGARRIGFEGNRDALASWGTDLVSVLMDSHTHLNFAMADVMFDGKVDGAVNAPHDRYVRINRVVRDKKHKDAEAVKYMDSVKSVEKLGEIGKELAEENFDKMKNFIRNIIMAEEKVTTKK